MLNQHHNKLVYMRDRLDNAFSQTGVTLQERAKFYDALKKFTDRSVLFPVFPEFFFDMARNIRILSRSEGVPQQTVTDNFSGHFNDLLDLHEIKHRDASVAKNMEKPRRSSRVKPAIGDAAPEKTAFEKTPVKPKPEKPAKQTVARKPRAPNIPPYNLDDIASSARATVEATGRRPSTNGELVLHGVLANGKRRWANINMSFRLGQGGLKDCGHSSLKSFLDAEKIFSRDRKDGVRTVTLADDAIIADTPVAETVVAESPAPDAPVMETVVPDTAAPDGPDVSLPAPQVVVAPAFAYHARDILSAGIRYMEKHGNTPTRTENPLLLPRTDVADLNKAFREKAVAGWDQFMPPNTPPPAHLTHFLVASGAVVLKGSKTLPAPKNVLKRLKFLIGEKTPAPTV